VGETRESFTSIKVMTLAFLNPILLSVHVLTVNSHQPYVYDMARISGIELLIIDCLPGRRYRL